MADETPPDVQPTGSPQSEQTPDINQQAAEATVTEAPQSKPSKPHLKIWIVLFVILLLGGAAAYWIYHKPAKPTPQASSLTKVTVHMGWLHQAQFAGFYVAKEKGYYRDAGLDVDLKEFQDGEDLNKEASEGTIDFGTSTPLEVLSARDKGYGVKAVAAIYQTSPYCFVSLKSANIKSPADLKGKTLGYVGNNTEAQVAYPALLSSYGISTSQVTTKDVDFDIVKNFQTNAADTADVYRTDQTYLLNKAGIAYNILLPEQFGFGLYGDVIITSDKLVKDHPDIASKFTQATLKGVSYSLNNQDEALTVTAKFENELYKDPDYEKYILKNSIPLIKPTGDQPIGNMEFVPWNRAYEAIRSAGLLKTKFSVTDAYTTEFIK